MCVPRSVLLSVYALPNKGSNEVVRPLAAWFGRHANRYLSLTTASREDGEYARAAQFAGLPIRLRPTPYAVSLDENAVHQPRVAQVQAEVH